MERKTQKSKKLATLYGFAAILMWSLLALLTQKAGEVPPFQLAAITFFIGTCVGLVWLFVNKPAQTHSPTPKRILFWGGFSLFAYHALYFAALQNAPVEEASLIAFLWPLLIVVGSALLPNEKLHSHHIAGALMGFAGAAIIITGNNALTFKTEAALGYGLAFIAAFTWAAYSLLSRRISDLPTQSVIAYCAITTLLSIMAHLIFEVTTWPNTIEQWGAIIGLGLLPVGAAFYVWDHGMKHGDIQIIGASSYTAPLLSTIILVVFGAAALTWSIVLACVLITLGAILAAKNILFDKAKS